MALLIDECHNQLATPKVGESDTDSTTTLSTALTTFLPCSLSIKQRRMEFWNIACQRLHSEPL